MKSRDRGRPRTKLQGQRGSQKRDVVVTRRKGVLFEQAESNSRKVPSKSLNLPSWDVKEVPSDEYEEDPPSFKIEDWRRELEFQKAMMRRYITTAVLAVWLGFALICVIRFAFTGDGLQLAAPVLLSEPLSVILKFYYTDNSSS